MTFIIKRMIVFSFVLWIAFLLYTFVPINISTRHQQMSIHQYLKPNIRSQYTPLQSHLEENGSLKLRRILLDNYIQFHQKQRLKAEEAKTHYAVIRTLVYHGRSWRGLGDRLRGVIQAYLLAVATNRVLLIDWQYPFPLTQVLNSESESGNFLFNSTIFAETHRKSNGRRDSIRLRNASFDHLEPFKGNISTVHMMTNPKPEWRKFLKVLRKESASAVLSELQKMGVLKTQELPDVVCSLIFRTIFQPSTLLKKKLEEIEQGTSTCFPCVLCRRDSVVSQIPQYISIHARLGTAIEQDAPKRFNLSEHELSLPDIAKCLAYHARETAKLMGLRYGNYFLATDTEDMKSHLKKELTSCKGCKDDVKIMHSECSLKHVRDLDGNNQDDFDIFMNTFVDLSMLAKGEALVSLPSGFAEVAQWMGPINLHKRLTFEQCSMEKKMRESRLDQIEASRDRTEVFL